MSTCQRRNEISEQVLVEASNWFIDCNEVELDTPARERFNEWLRRSPEHVQAYLEIAAAWDAAAALTAAHALDPTALVAQALAETNVVPFDPRVCGRSAPDSAFDLPTQQERAALTGARETSPASEPRASRAGGRIPWLFSGIAAAALVAVGIGFLQQPNTYTTAIGEQHSILLDDGSTVELDACSRLRVHFSQTERTVDLIDGQALFQVKKDTSRPFVVLSSGTRVMVVGTQFDVYRKASGTTVTVVEGRVAVTGESPQKRVGGSIASGASHAVEAPRLLSAGEQLTVSPRAIPHAILVDITVATAWTRRQLIFQETPLSEVVAEFNRYNSDRIVIEDPALAAFHISGHFEASEPDRLIQSLRQRFDVDVREHTGEIHVSRK